MKQLSAMVINFDGGDPNYPDGKAINDGVPGDNTGTELVEAWVNEILGGLYALIRHDGTVPDGVAENQAASQILVSVREIGVTGAKVFDNTIAVLSTNEVFYDGGGDTYTQESAANILQTFVGGTSFLAITAATATMNFSNCDAGVDSTKQVFYDGGGDTYTQESAANILQTFVGGTSFLAITAATATMNFSNCDAGVDSTKHLFLDGGDDTYLTESAANVVQMVTSAAPRTTWTNTGIQIDTHPTSAAAANAIIDTGNNNILTRSTSSIRYKSDIRKLDVDSSLIYEMNPVSFADKKNGGHYIGFIAEDIDKLDPVLCTHDLDGRPNYVQYDRLSVLLIAEMKKMKTKIKELENA